MSLFSPLTAAACLDSVRQEGSRLGSAFVGPAPEALPGKLVRASVEGVRATRSNGFTLTARAAWSIDGRERFVAYNRGMDAHCLIPEPDVQEWRRSLPFFLIAIALHAAVLLFPLRFTVGEPEMPQPGVVNVRLVEPSSVPAPIVRETPPAAPPSSPKRERAVATARPKLAMAPEQAATTAAFSVPAPIQVTATSAPQVAPAAVQVSSSVVAPRFDAAYLDNPRPAYPPLSRRLGEEGKVLLRVRVSREGLAVAVDLEKSSNFERLDEVARAVVSRWRFVPARRGDEAIEATVIVPIVFRLDG